MDIPRSTACLLALALLALSAFFSATQTAFASLNMIRIRTLAEDGDKKAARILGLAERWNRLTLTLLICNNLANIAFSVLIAALAADWFSVRATAAAIGIAALLILIFGETLPKSAVRNNAEKWALSLSGLLSVLVTVLTPLSWLLLKLGGLLHHGNGDEKLPSMTEQEFLSMLDTIEEEGVLEQREKELMESAVQFYDSTVQEIITPRVNIIALDVEDDPAEILTLIREERFSRIPVYEDTIDNIIGVVQARDVLDTALAGNPIDLRTLMSEPMYIHRTMKISRLLSDFQKEKTHMAVVIDDYGGTLGIATMEDLLEELVGEIWDEDEEIVEEYKQLPDGSYDVSGDMSAAEFFDRIGYVPDSDDEDWNTLNGWAMECLEHIPQPGEQFTCGPLAVTVVETDEQKINKMNIRRVPAEQPAQD